MHSDAWWQQAFEGELSPQEAQAWQAHLEECATCRCEWEALAQVDALLATPPPTPPLPADFTARTVAQVMHTRRVRRLLMWLGGFVLVAIVLSAEIYVLATTFSTLERALVAFVTGHAIWLNALRQTLARLLEAGPALLTLTLAATGIVTLFLTPNSVFATLAFIWLTRENWQREPHVQPPMLA